MEQEKKCCRCGEVKSINDFYFEKRRNSYTGHCKLCQNSSIRMAREKKIESGKIKVLWRVRNMSSEDKKQVLKLYKDGFGAMKISRVTGFAKCSILRFLRKEDVIDPEREYRKHKFKNENYFDQIDSEDKAYFLGLLWADGCNFRKDEKGKQAYQIVISLKEEDGYMIKKLAQKVFLSDEIVVLVDKSGGKDGCIRQNQNRLRIPSKHISDTLLSYGMTSRKSFSAAMPEKIQWTENLFRWFVRGVFDGDGSIFFNSNSKHYGISIIGSPEQIEGMKQMIKLYTGIEFHTETKKKYSQPMHSLKIHGSRKSLAFCNWMYENSIIHLDRKYKRYLTLKESRTPRESGSPTAVIKA